MKLIKNFVVSIAVLLAVAYGIYWAGENGWLKDTPLSQVDHQQFNFLDQKNLDQTKILSDRAKETSGHMQNVLGDTVEVDEQKQNKPLHEKTMEYARYLYCKQVVEDWEQAQQPTNQTDQSTENN